MHKNEDANDRVATRRYVKYAILTRANIQAASNFTIKYIGEAISMLHDNGNNSFYRRHIY